MIGRENFPWDEQGHEAERAPRAAETRHVEQRREAWKPASKLPDPNPREGWVHRWIRVSIFGEVDANNFSQARREGWEPCRPDEYPELQLEMSLNASQFAANGLIEVGGLVLCRMPQEVAAQREAYYEEENRRINEGVDNNFLQNRDARTGMRTVANRQTRETSGSTPA